MPTELIEKLITLCISKKLSFGSFSAYLGEYIVTAHNPKLAGRKPILEEKRDYLDYKLDMDAWNRRGMIVLSKNRNPIKALEDAIEYLEQC